jgi:hypothetical protein
MRIDYHVVPLNGSWGVKAEGATGYEITTFTKVEAHAYAIGLAREAATSVILHGRNGRIQAVVGYDYLGPDAVSQ